MDKAALKKREIYNKLTALSEQELGTIADFIDFMRQKKNLEENKILKMEGILKGHKIDFSDLTRFKEGTWKHVDEESLNG